MLPLMPEELVVEILQYLPLKALSNVMRTNSKFHRICRDDRLWVAHPEFPYRLKSEFSEKKNLVSSWISANITGVKVPPARLCQTAVVYGDSMYINGGHTTVSNTQLFNNVKSDTWRFNFVTKVWEELTEAALPPKTEHSAVVWDNKMWLFGGFAGTHFTADLTCYDFQTKSVVPVEPTGDLPSPRSAHVAVAHKGKMWVFGGWNGTEQNNDLYAFDFATHVWTKVPTPAAGGPLPRCSHCAALAPQADSMFIFGGCGGRMQNYLADLWQFNFETMKWTDVGRLQPGSRMKMVEYRNKLYVYGGWNSVDHFNHFNEYNIATGAWRKLDPGFGPTEGKMGQFSMVIFNHKMYKFAGYNDSAKESTNDLHAYRIGKPDFTEGSMSAQ